MYCLILTENENEIIDTLKANQMSGRSGRRGIDREGHIEGTTQMYIQKDLFLFLSNTRL